MDLQTSVLFGVIGLVALNQLVLRVGALRARSVVFWGLQALNLALLTYVLVWGLPGFEQWPVVSWLIGLMIAFRTIQNNGLRARFLREQELESRQDHDKRVEELTRKLRESKARETEPSEGS